MVEKESKSVAGHAYAHPEQPYAVAGFSEEIAQRPDEAHRLTLATVLSNWGTKCTLPAKRAPSRCRPTAAAAGGRPAMRAGGR